MARPTQHPSIAYAGIGSRRTPENVLETMRAIATALAGAGITLSTGGAAGADTAFARAAHDAGSPFTLHLPWPGYDTPSLPSRRATVVDPAESDTFHGRRFVDIARRHHPAWGRCRQGARACFVRNVSILAGARGSFGRVIPVRAVVAWTPNGAADGRDAGGTGHALRIARRYGIPTVNLSRLAPARPNAAALAAMPRQIRDVVQRCASGTPH